ncbi:hypothetical protein [Thermovibrio sp.]
MRGKKAFLAFVLLLGALVSSYFALEAYANYKLKEKIDRRLSKLPEDVSYQGFHYNLLFNDLDFKDITVKEGNLELFKIRELKVDLPFFLRKKEVPDSLKVEAYGITVPSVYLLNLIGYKVPNLKFDFTFGYSIRGNELLGSSRLKAYGLAEFLSTVSVKARKAYLKKLLEGRLPLSSAESKLYLQELKVVYRDSGLFNRALSYISSQEGETILQVKEELKKTVAESLRNDPKLFEVIGYPLIRFIDNPKCLSLKVKPKEPVSFTSLKRLLSSKLHLNSFIEELGIKLSTCP